MVVLAGALLAIGIVVTGVPILLPDDGSDGEHRPGQSAPMRIRGPVDRYVALGDSFTAGPLIPYVDETRTDCLRSSANYPAVLGRWLGAGDVVDVSCIGADTSDLPAGQLAAVTASTDLVTVGIGGNDFGVFGALVARCPALAATDPTGAPCRKAFTAPDGTDRLAARMGEVERRVAAVLGEIGRRAPDAVRAVVGYPRLLPTSGPPADRTCPQLPFAVGDYRWVDGVEQALNAALTAAAERSGAVYIDTYAGSRGHDACAGAAAWVNGRRTLATEALAYHPLAAGMVGSAKVAYETLTGTRPTRPMLRRAERQTQQRPPGALTLPAQRVLAALLSIGLG